MPLKQETTMNKVTTILGFRVESQYHLKCPQKCPKLSSTPQIIPAPNYHLLFKGFVIQLYKINQKVAITKQFHNTAFFPPQTHMKIKQAFLNSINDTIKAH
ncbi:unnamed protein product [Prunus armeniaca]